MIKIASWNVRGLNSPLRQREVKDFIKNMNIGLIGLLEVKIRENNFKNIARRVFRNWNVLHNSLQNLVSRIILAWNPNIFIGKVLYCTDQSITASFKLLASRDNEEVILTVVYGSNDRSTRRELWRELRYQNLIYNGKPWLIMGDFNIVINSRGKSGTKRIDRNAIRDFIDWINDMDMSYIPSRGCEFTWSNNRDGDQRVYTKIDHMFCNEAWQSLIQDFQLDYGASISSDNSPGILSMQLASKFGPRPFKFMKGWMSHPKFKSILESSWNEMVQGNPMIRLCKKLKNLKVPLKRLNKEHYSQISLRVERASNILENTQKRLMDDPTNKLMQEEEKSHRDSYIKFLDFEETFFKEKSRIRWMKEGDKNQTAFNCKQEFISNTIAR